MLFFETLRKVIWLSFNNFRVNTHIFLHITNTDYSGTAGCLALKQDDLIELLQNINIDTKIYILD
jgi:L,D-peptidoglycan transpeptidase YkuD (ErfK/YbiS/YcfS/YnhG family)